jgi:sugar lactone lactonase YvrE
LIDDDQTLYIADGGNHRIVEWESNATNGRIVGGGNGEGVAMNQLYRPHNLIIDKENNSFIIFDYGNGRIMRWSRQNNTENRQIIISDINGLGLAMDKDRSLYASDHGKNEVRRWKRGETNGTIVAGGNGKGNNLNQLNNPDHIFVDKDYSLYISDRDNERVMKWLKDAKEGIVVAGGNGRGKSLAQFAYPLDLIIDSFGQIYVIDVHNNRVMCWHEGAKEGSVVVGGNGEGKESNQLSHPCGLSFDIAGNLYVADCNNNRIQKFEIDFD